MWAGASVVDLSVKRLRAAALRDSECANAMSQAARIAPRFLPALPSQGDRRSVVSLEEAQRSAAVAACAPSWPSSLVPCSPPSGFSPAGSTGDASGALPGNTPPSPGKFAVSNHLEMLALRSSIAAHPASPKLTGIAVRTSATRARKRVVILTVGPVASSLVCRRGGARVAPYGCDAVNSDLAQAIVL